MPWHLEKRGKGYVVVTDATGRTHEKYPIPKGRAKRQLAALYASKAK
jgi:hypothetical protein